MQGIWHVSEIDGAEAWLKTEVCWGGRWRGTRSRRAIASTLAESSVQIPMLQRAPHSHKEQHCLPWGSVAPVGPPEWA